MEKGNHRPSKLIFAIGFILISLVSAIVFVKHFNKAFPASAIPLTTDKNEAIQKGKDFLEKMQYCVDNYKILTTFETDEQVDFYLQRKLGIEKLNQLTRDNRLCLHYWRIRFFRPLNQEEFVVGIAPNGDFDGFRRIIPEDLRSEKLTQLEAQKVAEQFVRGVMRLDLSSYALSSSSTNEKDYRSDHSFTWKRQWPELTETGEEILVIVQGNKVGFFEKYIRVPETFTRAFQRERSYASLLSTSTTIPSLLLMLCATITLIFRIAKRKEIEWRFGISFGMITVITCILVGLNHFHRMITSYSTSEDWGVFLTSQFILVLISSCFVGVQTVLYGSVGKSIDKEIFQREKCFVNSEGQVKGIFKNLMCRCGVGYGLAFIFLACHTVLYLIASNSGAWLPSKPRFSDFLLSYVPILTILGSAFYATLTEEIPYRLFSIPFLKKHLRITWIAVFIPALIWATKHAGYVVYPVYLKIIEITIVGVIYGIFFIRFGLLTVMIAHYLVDAIVGVVITMNPSLLVYKITMFTALLMPILVVLMIYWLGSVFLNFSFRKAFDTP